MKAKTYSVSFRCYYGAQYNTHRQGLELTEIPKWIEAYTFTHPNCTAISVKVWMKDDEDEARQKNCENCGKVSNCNKLDSDFYPAVCPYWEEENGQGNR